MDINVWRGAAHVTCTWALEGDHLTAQIQLDALNLIPQAYNGWKCWKGRTFGQKPLQCSFPNLNSITGRNQLQFSQNGRDSTRKDRCVAGVIATHGRGPRIFYNFDAVESRCNKNANGLVLTNLVPRSPVVQLACPKSTSTRQGLSGNSGGNFLATPLPQDVTLGGKTIGKSAQ